MTIEIRNPSGFPKTIGVTDPGICPIENTPEVAINSEARGNEFAAWLTPVQRCPFPEPVAYCAGAQDVEFGKTFVAREGGLLTWPIGAPDEYLGAIDIQVVDAQNAPSAHQQRRVVLRIGQSDAAKILQSELEHTADHRHAFAITVDHLTDSINEIAEHLYTGATLDGAKTALLQALAASAGALFVPAKPYDLARWRDRVATVYAHACNKTEARDAPSGNHKIYWYALYQNDDILLIYPRVQDAGPASQELITLDGIAPETPVWAVPPPPAPRPARTYAVGNMVLATPQWAEEQVDIFTDDSLTGAVWLTRTFRQIEADTYDLSPSIDVVIIRFAGEDGYVVQTQLTDPDSTSDPQARKDCYFLVRERHMW